MSLPIIYDELGNFSTKSDHSVACGPVLHWKFWQIFFPLIVNRISSLMFPIYKFLIFRLHRNLALFYFARMISKEFFHNFLNHLSVDAYLFREFLMKRFECIKYRFFSYFAISENVVCWYFNWDCDLFQLRLILWNSFIALGAVHLGTVNLRKNTQCFVPSKFIYDNYI